MIKPCYYKGECGNKSYDLELMLRLYLLQNLYNLSDEATVAEAIDNRAFSNFCGMESNNQVPDGDTLGRFRDILVHNGLQEQLLIGEKQIVYGDNGYLLGTEKCPEDMVKNKFSKQIRYKINRRPSQCEHNPTRFKA